MEPLDSLRRAVSFHSWPPESCADRLWDFYPLGYAFRESRVAVAELLQDFVSGCCNSGFCNRIPVAARCCSSHLGRLLPRSRNRRSPDAGCNKCPRRGVQDCNMLQRKCTSCNNNLKWSCNRAATATLDSPATELQQLLAQCSLCAEGAGYSRAAEPPARRRTLAWA